MRPAARPGKRDAKRPGCAQESISLGNPAIFGMKTRGFPPPPRGGFGFIGTYLYRTT